MATFNFPYHTIETENPESSVRIQLGGSYTFTAPPSDPDQRIFTLHFSVMKFFLDEDEAINEEINPLLNMMTLIRFYHEHKTYKSFQYNHPIHGTLEVRFNKPLPEPEGLANGDGAVKGFDVSLVEVP